jgi:peptidoglycan/LPS O-acetylase OafA/YrhL
MTAGVGLFGILSGFVAAWFLAPTGEKQESDLQLLRAEIRELRRTLEVARTLRTATEGHSPEAG